MRLERQDFFYFFSFPIIQKFLLIVKLGLNTAADLIYTSMLRKIQK